MKILPLIPIIAILFSCSKSNNCGLAGKTSVLKGCIRYPVESAGPMSFENNIRKQLDNYLITDSINLKKFYALEKSAYNTKHALKLKKKSTISYGDIKGIYPQMEIYLYTYKTSGLCSGAFTDWLHTIGDMEKIEQGVSIDHVKTAPVYAAKNDTCILVLSYLCEHSENNWDTIKTILNKYISGRGKLVMNIECGGPLTWSYSELSDK